MIENRISDEAERSANEMGVVASVVEWLFGGSEIKMKPIAERRSPLAMMGIEYKRIRRRPMISIRTSAARVNRKFEMATERLVRVGDVNPTSEKIVAEKYIKEF